VFRHTRHAQAGLLRCALAGALLLAAAAFVPAPVPAQPPRHADEPPTVVAALAADQRFRVFSRAVDAAGLGAALKGRGPFTLLAPTDEAFDRMGAQEVTRLLRPENKARLASILKYHIVSGWLSVEDLAQGRPVETVHGQRFHPTRDDRGIRVNDARVLDTDLRAGNGVIHTLDAVLLPSEKTLWEALRSDEQLAVFADLLADTDLLKTLTADGPLTVFAPTNEAFMVIGPADALKADAERLRRIIQNHVVTGRRVYLDPEAHTPQVKTLGGQTHPVLFREGRFRIGAATIMDRNLDLANGVLHTCDAVILPN
jgi:transforming growth factor-beta-induced protein